MLNNDYEKQVMHDLLSLEVSVLCCVWFWTPISPILVQGKVLICQTNNMHLNVMYVPCIIMISLLTFNYYADHRGLWGAFSRWRGNWNSREGGKHIASTARQSDTRRNHQGWWRNRNTETWGD